MNGEKQKTASPGSARLWACLAVLLVVTVGLRWGAVAQYEAEHPLANAPVIDELSYVQWGARIADGDWLGNEVFFQEPLYPYFIGLSFKLLGPDLHRLRLVQCLLGGLTALLVWAIANKLFGRRAAWIAAAAFAVFPPAMLLPSLFLKPNLFLPIFALFTVLLIDGRSSRKRWVLIGALGGLGALLRGNLLILLPCFFLWPFLRARLERKPWGQAAGHSGLFAAGVALVLMPVFLRNWVVGDQFALTTSGAGTNVYGGNNKDNPYGIATEFPWVRGIPRYEAGDWRREAERRLGRDLDGSESSSYWLGQVVLSMGTDPALHLSILWNKLRLALNRYEVPDNHHIGWDARYVDVLRWPWPGFGLLGGLGLGGMLLACVRRDLRGKRLQLALVFVLYLGTIVATVMSMRARLPLVVVLFPFSGYCIVELVRSLGPGANRRKWGATLLPVCIGLAIPFVPVFNGEKKQQDLAERDYNLAVSWLARSVELESATAIAQDLAARYPNSARLQILLADTRWRLGSEMRSEGRSSQGEALVSGALARLQPITKDAGVSPRERSRAYRLAAYIQADLGNWPAAERFFRGAREFAGEDPELLLSHAKALLVLARQAGAAPELRSEARGLLGALLAANPKAVEAQAARDLLASD